MAVLPVFSSKDIKNVAVRCLSCEWAGKVSQCKAKNAEIVRCPKCNCAVMRTKGESK